MLLLKNEVDFDYAGLSLLFFVHFVYLYLYNRFGFNPVAWKNVVLYVILEYIFSDELRDY